MLEQNRTIIPTPPKDTVWTDERVALLKKMAGDGDSAAVIALAMDTTRNSVLGKLHRLGLADELPLVWTEARVTQLIKLWRDGLSYRQIATELELSRNTVMGKGIRLRLAKTYPRVRVAAVRNAPAAKLVERKRVTAQGRVMTVFDRAVEQAPPRPEFLGIALLDLEDHHCRYPFGPSPYLFCGQPTVDGTSWCKHCLAVVSQPPTPRRAAA